MELGKSYFWVRVDEDGEPYWPAQVCSAWWGDSDKPTIGIWVLVRVQE